MLDTTPNKQWDFLPELTVDMKSHISSFANFIFYLWVIWTVFWLCSIILFFFRWHTSQNMIIMRSPVLSTLASFGAEIAYSFNTIKLSVTSEERFPCFLDLNYVFTFLPLYFIPFVLRFARYIFTMLQLKKWQEGKIKDIKKNIWNCKFLSLLQNQSQHG